MELHKGAPDTGMSHCWDGGGCPEDTRNACPAYPDMGMECWKVTGTICSKGRIRKMSLSEKIIYCRNDCSFYRNTLKKRFP